MKQINKKLINAAILIIALLLLLSTISYAKPFTDALQGGLIQINSFFTGEQYKPYAKTIDFFFFALLFTAIYMMGARYAFKEVKKPEQVIVILLGLMTAFLLVLGGWSATLLLPYINWFLYTLLFIFYFWLLKGIKSKFWRFILALLLTLLTIALFQGLFGSLTSPDTQGFFSSLGKSFGPIQFPGVQPYDFGNLFGNVPSVTAPSTTTPSVTPTITPTPAESKSGFSWWWLLLLLLLLLSGRIRGLIARPFRRRQPQAGTIAQIIEKINEIISKKEAAANKIKDAQEKKTGLLSDATRAQVYIQRLTDEDLALVWTDESKNKLKQDRADIADILDEDFKIFDGLKALREVEKELYEKLDSWRTDILRERNTEDIATFVQELKALIANPAQVNDADYLINVGILRLIEFLANVEKKEAILAKEIGVLTREENIEAMIKDKFKSVRNDHKKLKDYLADELHVVSALIEKIKAQIVKLNELKARLGGIVPPVTPPTTPPTQPPPTKHPEWPKKDGKFDPNPPEDPIFPIQPVIPRPKKPKPTKYEKEYIDLSKWFMPIKNQERSNACAAFAGTSIVEFYRNKIRDLIEDKVKLAEDLSELFLWYNFRNNKQNNDGPYTFEITKVFESIREEGVCFDGVWTWEPVANGIPTKFATQPTLQAFEDALTPYGDLTKQIEGWRELNPAEPDQWVAYLKNNYPIYIGIECDDEFKNAGKLRKSIYYNFIGNGHGHALVIVGFTTHFPNPNDPKKPIAAFKIRNSWGIKWGENGYIWVPYDLLPQLLIINPYVFIYGKGGEKPKKQKAHTLILTPTNSTPDDAIEIIGEQHLVAEKDGNTDLSNVLTIGRLDGDERKCYIVLKDTKINSEEEPISILGFYTEHENLKNIFKISYGNPTTPRSTITIIDKNGTKRTVLKFDYITDDDKQLIINEYTFDVDVLAKEQEIIQRPQYLERFEDKILRLKPEGEIKVEIVGFDGSAVKYIVHDQSKMFDEYGINFYILKKEGKRPVALSDKSVAYPNKGYEQTLAKSLSRIRGSDEYQLIVRAIPLTEKGKSRKLKFYAVISIRPIRAEIKSFDGEKLVFNVNDPFNKYSSYGVDLYIREKGKRKFIEIETSAVYDSNQDSVLQVSGAREFDELKYGIYEVILRVIPIQNGRRSRTEKYYGTLTVPLKQIVNPQRDGATILYIGQSIPNLEAKTYVDAQRRFVYHWFILQREARQLVQEGSYGSFSAYIIGESFVEGPAELKLEVYERERLVTGDKVEVHLLRGNTPTSYRGDVRIIEKINDIPIYEVDATTGQLQKKSRLQLPPNQPIEALGVVTTAVRMQYVWVLFNEDKKELLNPQWRVYNGDAVLKLKSLNPGKYVLGFIGTSNIDDKNSYIRDYVAIEIVSGLITQKQPSTLLNAASLSRIKIDDSFTISSPTEGHVFYRNSILVIRAGFNGSHSKDFIYYYRIIVVPASKDAYQIYESTSELGDIDYTVNASVLKPSRNQIVVLVSTSQRITGPESYLSSRPITVYYDDENDEPLEPITRTSDKVREPPIDTGEMRHAAEEALRGLGRGVGEDESQKLRDKRRKLGT